MEITRLVPFRAKITLPNGATKVKVLLYNSEAESWGVPVSPDAKVQYILPVGAVDWLGEVAVVLGVVDEGYLCGLPHRQTEVIPPAFLEFEGLYGEV